MTQPPITINPAIAAASAPMQVVQAAPVITPPTSRSAPARPSTLPRILAAVVALGCLTVLILAARLTPSPDGHGTHSQLGLPPCGWVVMFNKPCPTCGMTTSFAHLAHGHPIASFQAQPAGMLLAITTAAAFWIALHAALTGSRSPALFMRLLKPRFLWTLAAIWLASWAYKIATWPTVGAAEETGISWRWRPV